MYEPGRNKKQLTSKGKRSSSKEWIYAFFIAVIAALLIRLFAVEAFNIPSASMNNTLLEGDLIFVSKLPYGARMPITPLSLPLVHQNIPLVGGRAYVDWIKLPYLRMPDIQSIQHNDVVVFNYPMDDKHPVDKRDYYVKRCIAVPGDTLEINNGNVFVNHKNTAILPLELQEYVVLTDGSGIDNHLLMELGITEFSAVTGHGTYRAMLTASTVQKLLNLKNVIAVTPFIWPDGTANEPLFPADSNNFRWNIDNYGPVWIPVKGTTINIDTGNISLYKRIITIYEGHKLKINADGRMLIDNQEAHEYTFKFNYYWMMGDNRHNSIDSRYWGFVPEDHIVGKAWFIGFSRNSFDDSVRNIRWNRIFQRID